MDEEEHYDTPWEYLARPTSIRMSTVENRLPSTSPTHNSLPQSPSASSHLVHIGNSPVDSKRHSLRSKPRIDPLKLRNDDEDRLLERNVDRVEAEKRLEGRAVGDFLLRYRNEGSAALSLRASTGILHIKLERRGDKWMIGEGPCFRTISSSVSYYRRHPLPIRGSDHLLLKQSVTQSFRI